MKQIHFACLLLASISFPYTGIAQKSGNENAYKAIKTVINQFFTGMETGDTSLIKKSCAGTIILQTYVADKEGVMQVYTEEFSDFLAMVGESSTDQYDERIKFEAIQAENSLASVWAPYTFYINGRRSHCGTNAFQLIKTTEGWKIQYILDTRRKLGCE